MSREIKFRGKAKMSIGELDYMHFEHENGWFYGNIVMYGNTPYIVGDFIEVDTEYTVNEFWVAVHPESVGQFTGLKDKNGKEIYEGDIVRHASDEGIYKVTFEDGGFYVKNLFEYDFQTINEYTIEVIGNIFEDKHLLKEESK